MHALDTVLVLATQLASLFSLGPRENVGKGPFYNPTLGGGSMLDSAMNGYGEPLNVGLFSYLFMSRSLFLTSALGLTGYHLGRKLSTCTDRRRDRQLCTCHWIVRLLSSLCRRLTLRIEAPSQREFWHSSEECFNIHLGTPFPADLGDGNGWVNQTIELRQDYDSGGIGTCLESLIGGNHFR